MKNNAAGQPRFDAVFYTNQPINCLTIQRHNLFSYVRYVPDGVNLYSYCYSNSKDHHHNSNKFLKY